MAATATLPACGASRAARAAGRDNGVAGPSTPGANEPQLPRARLWAWQPRGLLGEPTASSSRWIARHALELRSDLFHGMTGTEGRERLTHLLAPLQPVRVT